MSNVKDINRRQKRQERPAGKWQKLSEISKTERHADELFRVLFLKCNFQN